MSLVPSLLQAIVQLDGEALVMHVGDKPYVVSPTGQVDLATRGLGLDAVVGIVNQLMPPESQRALDEFGAAQYELPPMAEFPGEQFTIVAARGGDDVWAEIRRRRVSDDDHVPLELFGSSESTPVSAAPEPEIHAQELYSAEAATEVGRYAPHVDATADDDLLIPDGHALWGPSASQPAEPAAEVPLPLQPPPARAPEPVLAAVPAPRAVAAPPVVAVTPPPPAFTPPPVAAAPPPPAPVVPPVAAARPLVFEAPASPPPVWELPAPRPIPAPSTSSTQPVPAAAAPPLHEAAPVPATPVWQTRSAHPPPAAPPPAFAPPAAAAAPPPPAFAPPVVAAAPPPPPVFVAPPPQAAEAVPPAQAWPPLFSVASTPAPPPQAAVVLPLARSPLRPDAPPPLAEQALSGLDKLLRLAAARGASALYLSSAARPSVRVDGDIYSLEGAPVLGPNDVESLLLTLMPERNAEALRTGVASEWISDLQDIGRVRCLSFRDHLGPGGVFRMMPVRAVTCDQLGLSREIQALAMEPEGLVLVAGPRSSGKRTLMSALVDLINRSRRDHVVMIETEINIVHERNGSFISQR